MKKHFIKKAIHKRKKSAIYALKKGDLENYHYWHQSMRFWIKRLEHAKDTSK